MTLRCRFAHRWWRVTIPLVGLVLAVLTVITAARNPETVGESALAQPPRVVLQPADGATGVNPAGPIQIWVTCGVVDAIQLTNPAGKAVAGQTLAGQDGLDRP